MFYPAALFRIKTDRSAGDRRDVVCAATLYQVLRLQNDNLGRVAATHRYRIAQEAVSNSIKHAGAKTVKITFRRTDGGKLLTVEDDGLGISGQGRKPGGMGLHLMKYRAGLIGGQLSVTSPEAGGTVVSCLIPEESEHGE